MSVFESALLVFVFCFFSFFLGGGVVGGEGEGGVTLLYIVYCLKVLHNDFGAFCASLGISELHLFVWKTHHESNIIISCHLAFEEYL